MTAYPISSDTHLFDQALDAIVVPTNRSSEHISYALTLTAATNAFLLVFCNGRASTVEVANRINAHGVRGLAIDIPAHYQHPLLSDFETNNFPDAILGRAANDIGLKRNLGLIVGRMAGWSKLLFLDDDITNITEINQAISFVADEPAAGFLVSKFPDNSVVRHAERLSGVEPGVKLTGSALLINLAAITAFFPRIYNEDWFFLYGIGHGAFRSSAVGTASQKPYNPFRSPSRAASEEFGDVLAEGILQLTNAGFQYLQSTVSDWQHLLAERKSLIRMIRVRLAAQPSLPHSRAALKSLYETENRLNDIVPQACVAYIAAWNHDLDLFRERFSLLPYHGASMTQIVELAGLMSTPSSLTINYNVL